MSTSFHLRPVSDRSASPTTSSSTTSDRTPPPVLPHRPGGALYLRERDREQRPALLPPHSASSTRPRRPLSPSSLRDVDLSARDNARKYPAPPTGHELMAMFPPAPPLVLQPGPTSGYFQMQERKFFAQAGKEIVRVTIEVDLEGQGSSSSSSSSSSTSRDHQMALAYGHHHGGLVGSNSRQSWPVVPPPPPPPTLTSPISQPQPQFPHSPSLQPSNSPTLSRNLPPMSIPQPQSRPGPTTNNTNNNITTTQPIYPLPLPSAQQQQQQLSPPQPPPPPPPTHSISPQQTNHNHHHRPGFPMSGNELAGPGQGHGGGNHGGNNQNVNGGGEEYRDDPDEAWRRPMPHNQRRRAGKHTKRVVIK